MKFTTQESKWLLQLSYYKKTTLSNPRNFPYYTYVPICTCLVLLCPFGIVCLISTTLLWFANKWMVKAYRRKLLKYNIIIEILCPRVCYTSAMLIMK